MTTVWTPNTVYSLNQMVRPTVPNGYRYKCTAGGTSGEFDYVLKNSYTVRNMSFGVSEGSQLAQAFIPSTTHTVKRLILQPTKVPGYFAGNVIISIRATDGSGKPTGSDLCSASMLLADLTYSYIDVTFNLGNGALLTALTKYAIVARPDNPAGKLNFMGGTTPYAGGEVLDSSDGVTWAIYGFNCVMYFKEYSSERIIEPAWPTTPGATVSDGTAVWTNDGKRTIPHRSFIIG